MVLDTAPSAKDVVIAALGVDGVLAGLLLVFLGAVVTTYQSFGGASPAAVTRRYQLAGALVFGALVLAVTSLVISFCWLLLGGPGALYPWTVLVFLGSLLAMMGVSGYVSALLLRS